MADDSEKNTTEHVELQSPLSNESSNSSHIQQIVLPETSAVSTTANTLLQFKVNNFADYLCLLPTFSGTEENFTIKDFLGKVENIRKLGEWDDNHTISAVLMKLVGEADNFAKFHPAVTNAKTWAELKGELQKRFGKAEDKNFVLKLTQAAQRHNESTRGFLSRLSGLALKCFPNDEAVRENLLFNQALKGLSSSTRRFIMAQCPKTFQDIWQSALREEQCLDFDKHNAEINVAATLAEVRPQNSDLAEIKQLLQLNMLESDKKIHDLTEQVQQLTLLVNNSNQSQSVQPQNPPVRPAITCYSCGRRGHISRFCRNRQGGNGRGMRPLN